MDVQSGISGLIDTLKTLSHYFPITLKEMRFDCTQKRFENPATWSIDDNRKEILLRLSDVLEAHISSDDSVIQRRCSSYRNRPKEKMKSMGLERSRMDDAKKPPSYSTALL